MCIIAAIPAGKKVTKETFFNMWDSNPDGAGLMFPHRGKVHVIKELNSAKFLYEQYLQIAKLNVPIILHFRIATSGAIDEYNIHPFKINDELFFCHNGILDLNVPMDSKENDTQIFNNSILKGLPANFVYNKAIIALIQAYIGTSNKLVFLNSKGFIKIVNKRKGIIEAGIWYSNHTFKPFRKTYPTKPKKWPKWAKEIERDFYTNKYSYNDVCDSCGAIGNTSLDMELNWHVCERCNHYANKEIKNFNSKKDQQNYELNKALYSDKL